MKPAGTYALALILALALLAGSPAQRFEAAEAPVRRALAPPPAAYPMFGCDVLQADVNGDGTVTISDLAAVADNFLQGIPPANPRYDQDGDSTITISDLAAMAGNFLQSIATCPSVFVSTAGSAPPCGGMATPCLTIQQGIDTAFALGRSEVYVAAGTYAVFDMKDGVSVLGGFSTNFQRTPAVSPPATSVTVNAAPNPIEGQLMVVLAVGLSQPTTLAFLTLQGGNASDPGQSSYVVVATAVLAETAVPAIEAAPVVLHY